MQVSFTRDFQSRLLAMQFEVSFAFTISHAEESLRRLAIGVWYCRARLHSTAWSKGKRTAPSRIRNMDLRMTCIAAIPRSTTELRKLIYHVVDENTRAARNISIAKPSGYIAPKTLLSPSTSSAPNPPLPENFNISRTSTSPCIPPSSLPFMNPPKYLAIIS